MKNKHDSQRGWFAWELYNWMKKDKDIWLIVGDLGYKVFDQHFKDFPERCINVGAAEQSMLGVAIGLALEGKKPFTYTISSFYLRAAESINLYLDHEQIPVRMVGSGRDDDYKGDGYSHYAYKLQNYLHLMNVIEYYPDDKESIPNMVKNLVKINEPAFISLRR